jgi:hypothetical protein
VVVAGTQPQIIRKGGYDLLFLYIILPYFSNDIKIVRLLCSSFYLLYFQKKKFKTESFGIKPAVVSDALKDAGMQR